MDTPPSSEDARRRWEQEATLLARGRELLEHICAATRYRYLYPGGPNLGLLLAAYQEFDRMRAVRRVRDGRWRQWRAFRRILKDHIHRDMLDRSRRLSFRYPTPRLRRLPAPPELVRRALAKVDTDVAGVVKAHIGTQTTRYGAIPGAATTDADTAASRGLTQFRDALMAEALEHPESIPGLHTQYLWLLTSPLPTKRRHPIATAVFVKLPLQFVLLVFTIFNLAYVAAYWTFNDRVLGRFVSDNVSGLLEGELRLGSIHWNGRLIFDLLTGTPTYVIVEDVDVYEPHKSTGRGREGRAAHADRIEATLVLHEIIPWNRLGIPKLFEIPWVLHFGEVEVEEPIWFHIREYDDVLTDGTEVRYVGLRDAFRLYHPPDEVRRGLSFAVDDANLKTTILDIDYGQTAGWRTSARMSSAEFELGFEAPDPETTVPMELPFEFDLSAEGEEGLLQVAGLDIPLTEIHAERFASNKPGIPAGGVLYQLRSHAAGSEIAIQGTLRDVFARLFDSGPSRAGQVELYAYTDDVGSFASHIARELDMPEYAIDAEGVEASASIVGPLYDPVYTLSASGLILDVLGQPAWKLDDVTASVSMATIRPPQPWTNQFAEEDRRRVITFEGLSGQALGGTFDLREGTDIRAQLVVPADDTESILLSMPLRLQGTDPGRMVPDSEEVADALRGVASGDVDLRRFEFGPDPESGSTEPRVLVADLGLGNVELTRERGPQHDGIPKSITLDGNVLIGKTGEIDVEDLEVRTDGTRLMLDGGVDPGAERFKRLLWDLRIDDGHAFARAFDLPADYFERLDAKMQMLGSFRTPNGNEGRLTVAGVGIGSTKLATQASMWMDSGQLHLRAPDAFLYGGRGPVQVDVQVFERGGISRDPKLRAFVDLVGVDLLQLVADSPISGRADVELKIGDGEGGQARVSDLRVHGKARSEALTLGGTTYHDAEVDFRLTAEELEITRLVLPIHRPVSPRFARGMTVPVGKIEAAGTVSLQRDPRLDLLVVADGVPLSLVSKLLGVESPLRGQIGAGTRFTVGGSLRRPIVDGTVALDALSARGIALGGGKLEFTSEDVDAEGPLAAHRALRAVGELATHGRRNRIQWTVDAVATFGAARPGADSVPVAAQLDVEFDEVSLATLLRDPVDPTARPAVEGRLEGLTALVLTCNPGAPMLSDCVRNDEARTERSLDIDLELDAAWVRSAATPLPEGTAPCSSKSTLCSDGPLLAELHWPVLTLQEPWRLETGGKGQASFELSGSFDLTPPPDKAASAATEAAADALHASCSPPPEAGRTVPDGSGSFAGQGDARLLGTIDLAALAPLLEAYGLKSAKGRMDVNVRATGYAADPRLVGTAALVAELADGKVEAKAVKKSSGKETLILEVEPLPFPLEFSDLKLRMENGWIAASGSVGARQSTVEFGTVDGLHTGYALAGECAGHFGLAAKGTVSPALLRTYLGETISPGQGGVEIDRLVTRGSTVDEVELHAFEGRLGFARTGLGLALPGVEEFKLVGGKVDFRRCGPTDCPQAAEGWLILDVGGLADATSSTQPSTALRATAGPRGRAVAWGRAFLSPAFDAAVGTDLEVRLDSVPYRSYDRRGRLEYELALSTDNLQIEGGTPLVIAGEATVDRARYVKDAVQGVEILSLIEDRSTEVSSPPPDILQGLTYDVRVETDRPLRVENNIASGVEATAAVEVTGTFENPEFTGRLDVEPGGNVDIPFLTGTYEIQRGRVTLLRLFENAEVDVLALRNEPIYIRDQPRRVQLLLGGTLSEIRWSCIADGDAGGELDTIRGCTEYLVLGTGDVQLGENDVQRFGAGGLAGVRKPLQVVGHLTEFDVGKRASDAAPRLRNYVPDVKLRLGQIGPELEVATPRHWFDFNYGRATFSFDYTRGYPGFLLRQSREVKVKFQILDPITLEYSRRIRSYLNQRIVFDPLEQDVFELRFDVEIPTVR